MTHSTCDPTRRPTHPGEMLKLDILPQSTLTVTRLAELLELSRPYVYKIMAGQRPIQPDTAVRLGKIFGNGPLLWLNMQLTHDLWQAQQRVDLSAVPTFPVAPPKAA